jgi:hypothetical protein
MIAFLALLSIAPFAYPADDATSFIKIKSVKHGTDESGNELFDIVLTNTHKSRAIFATVGWISVARERETDAYLKPGKEKTIAHDQPSAREIHVASATFR